MACTISTSVNNVFIFFRSWSDNSVQIMPSKGWRWAVNSSDSSLSPFVWEVCFHKVRWVEKSSARCEAVNLFESLTYANGGTKFKMLSGVKKWKSISLHLQKGCQKLLIFSMLAKFLFATFDQLWLHHRRQQYRWYVWHCCVYGAT